MAVVKRIKENIEILKDLLFPGKEGKEEVEEVNDDGMTVISILKIKLHFH